MSLSESAAELPASPPAPPPDAISRGAEPSLNTARLLVVAAALLWSTAGLFAKAPIFAGWPGPVMAFWRALFACVILLPMVRRPQWSWRLVPMAAMFAAMNYTYLTALTAGTAANAIWLQNTAPVWVLLVGVLVFGERAIRRDIWLVGFCAAGVGLILAFESRGVSLAAVGWGMLSGLLYAGVVLSLRQLRDMDSMWLVAVSHVATVAALAPLALGPVLSGSEGAAFPSGIQWPLLAAFGILQLGIPYALFARGLRAIPGHEATGIALLEPILLPVWVLLVWGERQAWWTLAGGGLILAGLVVRYLPLPRLIPGLFSAKV
jgi:DME family drug/metabolite transporter